MTLSDIEKGILIGMSRGRLPTDEQWDRMGNNVKTWVSVILLAMLDEMKKSGTKRFHVSKLSGIIKKLANGDIEMDDLIKTLDEVTNED